MNRWYNWLDLISSINFLISHVFREGNTCTDKLANIGLTFN